MIAISLLLIFSLIINRVNIKIKEKNLLISHQENHQNLIESIKMVKIDYQNLVSEKRILIQKFNQLQDKLSILEEDDENYQNIKTKISDIKYQIDNIFPQEININNLNIIIHEDQIVIKDLITLIYKNNKLIDYK